MSDFYNSLKEKIHDTLQWRNDERKDDFIPLVRVNNAVSLEREMERLEKFVVDRVGRLKEALKRGEANLLEESRQAEQLAGNLKAEIVALKATIEEAERASESKDLAHVKMTESLSVEIQNLQAELKKRDETLATRNSEISDYKFKIDENVKRMSELELANTEIKELAARHAKRTEDIAKSSWAKITALESRINETEALARQKELMIVEELQQQLSAKTQEFENALKGERELLTQRDSEITDLKAQLKRFKKGIHEISYLFREAESLTDLEEQNFPGASQNESSQRADREPAAPEPLDDQATALALDLIPDLVSPEIVQRIVSELAQAANVITAVASIIVHRQAKSLGESLEKFPTARLPELLEVLAREITDEDVQLAFRERITNSIHLAMN